MERSRNLRVNAWSTTVVEHRITFPGACAHAGCRIVRALAHIGTPQSCDLPFDNIHLRLLPAWEHLTVAARRIDSLESDSSRGGGMPPPPPNLSEAKEACSSRAAKLLLDRCPAGLGSVKLIVPDNLRGLAVTGDCHFRDADNFLFALVSLFQRVFTEHLQ